RRVPTRPATSGRRRWACRAPRTTAAVPGTGFSRRPLACRGTREPQPELPRGETGRRDPAADDLDRHLRAAQRVLKRRRPARHAHAHANTVTADAPFFAAQGQRVGSGQHAQAVLRRRLELGDARPESRTTAVVGQHDVGPAALAGDDVVHDTSPVTEPLAGAPCGDREPPARAYALDEVPHGQPGRHARAASRAEHLAALATDELLALDGGGLDVVVAPERHRVAVDPDPLPAARPRRTRQAL